MTASVEDTLLSLAAALPPGKSLDPAAVAKALGGEEWRRLLPQIRATAVGLARQGKIIILRHGKEADPGRFKGVYRVRLV